MTLIVNVRESGRGAILVVTDSELIGKQFEEDELQLDLAASFYAGTEMPVDEIIEKAKGSYILHVTGEEAVKALSLFIDPNSVVVIDAVPHAEVYLGA